MKMTKYALTALISGIFMFASCKNKELVIRKVPAEKLTATLQVEKGADLKIELPSNPSTGCVWILKNKIKPKKIAYKSKKYVTNPQQNRFIGGGGNDEWLFEALRCGKTFLLFEYKDRDGNLQEERYYKVEVLKSTSKK